IPRGGCVAGVNLVVGDALSCLLRELSRLRGGCFTLVRHGLQLINVVSKVARTQALSVLLKCLASRSRIEQPLCRLRTVYRLRALLELELVAGEVRQEAGNLSIGHPMPAQS